MLFEHMENTENLIGVGMEKEDLGLMMSTFWEVHAENVPPKTFAVFSRSSIAADDTTAVQELGPDDRGALLLQIMM